MRAARITTNVSSAEQADLESDRARLEYRLPLCQPSHPILRPEQVLLGHLVDIRPLNRPQLQQVLVFHAAKRDAPLLRPDREHQSVRAPGEAGWLESALLEEDRVGVIATAGRAGREDELPVLAWVFVGEVPGRNAAVVGDKDEVGVERVQLDVSYAGAAGDGKQG